MLYKKRFAPSLSEELFQDPTSEFRGAPFWAWNTNLQQDELNRQIDIFDEMGIGGFHMHSRSGMATPYLTDDFMNLVRGCAEHAKEKNMLAWLYDEDRWPSGAAGGIITKNYRYRQRMLIFDCNPPKDDILPNYEAYLAALDNGGKPHGYAVSRYTATLDKDGCLAEYKQLADGEEADKVYYAYVRISDNNPWYNNEAYLDLLNPAAVREFIRVTYDRYYECVGDEFDKTIPGIFTDEPQYARRSFVKESVPNVSLSLAWTDDFDTGYTAQYGESFLAHLPEMVWELPDGKLSVTRYRYADFLCERFASSFVDQIGKWCGKHNIAFTGHLMSEASLNSQSGAVGETIRCYRNFQLPGIDMLCASVELTTAKQTASAVHQYGREGMLSELYGVTGWDYDFRGHKEQGDWQAALGVTVRVHHLTWVSMNGEAKRDYPASIGYQSSWYKKYRAVEDHFARVNTALTRGTPSVRIAVVHPIESYWLHLGPNDKTEAIRSYLDNQFMSLTSTLLNNQLDFDFLSESVLPEICPMTDTMYPLSVGKMKYDVVVVPVVETIRRTTLERLKAFAAAGGEVILLGNAPTMVDAIPSEEPAEAAKHWTRLDVDHNALVKALAPYRFADVTNLDTGSRCTGIIHQVRDDGDGKWVFLCHSSPVENRPLYILATNHESVRIGLAGQWAVQVYDTLSGKIYTPAYKIVNGTTYVEYKFYAADSLLLKLTPTTQSGVFAGDGYKRVQNIPARDITAVSSKKPLNMDEITLNPLLSDPVPYTLNEPNALLLDRVKYAFDGEAYSKNEIDSLLVADIGRANFFKEHQGQRTVQPWVPVPEEVKNLPPHTVRRMFTFTADISVKGASLALEMPAGSHTKLWLNGAEVPVTVTGWYVDKCIQTVALPEIPAGKAEIEVEQSFGLRSCTEWCYLLGDFGVNLIGKYAHIIPRAETLAFASITGQTLPFYTGTVTYHCTFDEPQGGLERRIRTARFGGAVVGIRVDGGAEIINAYPPYCVSLGTLSAGQHKIDITVYVSRQNGFGSVHNCVPGFRYWGPNSWRTHGTPGWTDSYILSPAGLLDAPEIK